VRDPPPGLLSACISGSQALTKGDCMTTSKPPAGPSLELGNPGDGERHSGMKPNTIPG
jgi:hypothetical protein